MNIKNIVKEFEEFIINYFGGYTEDDISAMKLNYEDGYKQGFQDFGSHMFDFMEHIYGINGDEWAKSVYDEICRLDSLSEEEGFVSYIDTPKKKEPENQTNEEATDNNDEPDCVIRPYNPVFDIVEETTW